MDYLLLDTCIVLHLFRNNDYSEKCKQAINTFSNNPVIVLSVVTIGELEALKKQQNWSEKRLKLVQAFIDDVTVIDVAHADLLLIEAYAKIDAFSKRKGNDDSGRLLDGSAKTMHKNDLWIAATANALDIPLMTTDGDFDHLNGIFLKIMKIV